MNDLGSFKMSDMIELGAALRGMGKEAGTMEEVAGEIVRFLFSGFRNERTGEKTCGLVRLYKTHPLGDLPPDLQSFATEILGSHLPTPEMKCLTLLASAGEKPEWNSRKTSAGHKAIPLPSEQMVLKFPMISQMVGQMGLEVRHIVNPNPQMFVELEQRKYNVFYVPDALGNPFIPAQADFVVPFGIKTVLGFGGMLPHGEMVVVILFSKVSFPREVADLFKTLALTIKMAVLPFVQRPVFQ